MYSWGEGVAGNAASGTCDRGNVTVLFSGRRARFPRGGIFLHRVTDYVFFSPQYIFFLI